MNNITPRTEIKSIKAYPIGDSLDDLKEKYHLDELVKMCDNENPYGMSPNVELSLEASLANIHQYPDASVSILTMELERLYNISKKHFIIGNGSDEIIRLLTRAYISTGDNAIVADGTFPRYETNVLIDGGTVIKVPLQNGVHDLDAMHKSITERTKMVFLCNPNNPTGTIVTKHEQLDFMRKIPENIMIVVDEAYAEYAISEEYLDTSALLHEFSNLVVLRTFSKIYGLAGLRIGYSMMNPAVAESLQKVKDVFNINSLAQKAAAVALADQNFIRQSAKKNAEERERVTKALNSLGYRPYPSQTNFIFVPMEHDMELIFESLLAKGLLVKKIGVPEAPKAFRVTLGTKEQNDRFLKTMSAFIPERMV